MRKEFQQKLGNINKTQEDFEMAVIKNFDEIVERVKGFPEPMRVIVAAAQDEHTLQAIKHAQEEGIAKPVLVGDKAEINKICAEIGLVVPEEDIYDVPDVDESAKRAVALIHEGKGDFRYCADEICRHQSGDCTWRWAGDQLLGGKKRRRTGIYQRIAGN